MKTEPNKRYNREYTVIITIQFPLFLSKKEEDEGTEIPHEIIVSEVNKCLERKEYDVQEEPME